MRHSGWTIRRGSRDEQGYRGEGGGGGIWSIETTLRRGPDSDPFLPNSKVLVPSTADNFPRGINRMHQILRKELPLPSFPLQNPSMSLGENLEDRENYKEI